MWKVAGNPQSTPGGRYRLSDEVDKPTSSVGHGGNGRCTAQQYHHTSPATRYGRLMNDEAVRIKTGSYHTIFG